MAAKVFISYRRDDSAGHAGRVHDRLAHEFGANLLFMDVDSIPLARTSSRSCARRSASAIRYWLRGDDYDDRMTTTTMTGLMAR